MTTSDRFDSSIPQYDCTHINQHIPKVYAALYHTASTEHSRPHVPGNPLALDTTNNPLSNTLTLSTSLRSSLRTCQSTNILCPGSNTRHQTTNQHTKYMILHFPPHQYLSSRYASWYSQLVILAITAPLDQNSHGPHILCLSRRVGHCIPIGLQPTCCLYPIEHREA